MSIQNQRDRSNGTSLRLPLSLAPASLAFTDVLQVVGILADEALCAELTENGRLSTSFEDTLPLRIQQEVERLSTDPVRGSANTVGLTREAGQC